MAPSELVHNLRRLMAQQGLTIAQLAQSSGLDERTIKTLLRGDSAKPHARTLHRLAAGLEVRVDELFLWNRPPHALSAPEVASPVVQQTIGQDPELFRDWTEADFHELARRLDTGQPPTEDQARQAARQVNLRREAIDKVCRLLETSEGQLLLGIIDLLYQRATLPSSDS